MTSPIYFGDHDDNGVLRIDLPHRIGYVEIRTGGVNDPTGHPAISVWAYSETEHMPADDGRLYEAVYTVRDDTIVLVGAPGPQMLERQRQAAQVEKVFELHNSGDHAQCPDICPAKEK